MNRFYNLKSFWSTKFNFPQFIIDQIIFVKIHGENLTSVLEIFPIYYNFENFFLIIFHILIIVILNTLVLSSKCSDILNI